MKDKIFADSLSKGHIQLWINKISDWKGYLGSITGWLSDDETARLERLKFVESRENFIISKGILRVILALMLKQKPEEVEIRITTKGKPFLSGSEIYFNLSHSENLMVVGLSLQAEIGIDLQKVYPITNHQTILKNFFSVKEEAYLNSLPEESFLDNFFTIWTAKEAYLKGIGEGFQYPSNSFSVIPENSQSGCLVLQSDHIVSKETKWTIHSLEPEPGYKAAAVIAGEVEKISLHSNSPDYFFK